MAKQGRDPGRDKFMFSSAWGQAWEAHENAKEARRVLARIVPEGRERPVESAPPASCADLATSGACFKRVMLLLGKRGRR